MSSNVFVAEGERALSIPRGRKRAMLFRKKSEIVIMRKQIITLILFVAMMGFDAYAQVMGSWDVVPLPQSIALREAAPFVLDANTTVYYDKSDAVQQRNAEFLVAYVGEMTGISLRTTTCEGDNQIRLALDATLPSAEGYRITAGDKVILLQGQSHAGVFYGMQTIMKALPVVSDAEKVALPAAVVNDAPRFGYRAFMIDVGRHFFSVDYLKKFIDIFALHNINYFHWHLTEDQGWRIEIKKYPLLTKVGSRRTETTLGGDLGYDGKPVEGFYTQEEAREIVRYAAERYITVIPEIDMPGHIQSALAAYPWLGCTGGPYEVCRDYGVIDEVLCAGNARTLQFAKDVIAEIMDIFPSPYIHIGGDECPKTRWKECAACQAKIAQLGLTDADGHSKEDQFQSWFMGEIEKDIKARGRKMLAWDEILDGTPSKDITVIGWTSPKACVRAAKAGHKAVMAPIQNFYFSNREINKITGLPSIERVYEVNPQADELTEAERQNIIGAEGCIWTEWVADGDKLEWELLPRLAALSEVQWTAPERKNLMGFMARMQRLLDIYRLKGLRYKDDVFQDTMGGE